MLRKRLNHEADAVSEWNREVIGMNNLIRLSSSFAEGAAGYEKSLTAPLDAAAFAQEEPMLDQLDRRERLRLVQFVCSFAWADFEIQPEERVFISRLIRRLELDEEENLQVQQWLDRPPSLDDLDPTSIPAAHRRFFVEAIEGLISADGEVADEERETFEIFKQLLVG
jgi:uncharacterized tellurite resistance protein B-like protein